MEKTLDIYTSRISYRGSDALDITVKSGDKAFAPTWDMVTYFKKGILRWPEFACKYLRLMEASLARNRGRWDEVMQMGEVTFVCYCTDSEKCHRTLLAKYFVEWCCAFGVKAVYKGERVIIKSGNEAVQEKLL